MGVVASELCKAVAGYVARLRLAEKLVFVFPQWWFNVPAILKGFFDRVASLDDKVLPDDTVVVKERWF